MRLTRGMDLNLNPHPFCTHRRKDGAPAPVIPRSVATRNLLFFTLGGKQIPRYARDDSEEGAGR